MLVPRTVVFCLKADQLQRVFSEHPEMRAAAQQIVDIRQAALDKLDSHYLLGHALRGATAKWRR